MGEALISTGIPALDHIFGGGLMPLRMYLVSGTPGSGKTTLGLQFLLEGRDRGEAGLYVTLSETREELIGGAASHGWSLEGISIFEMPLPRILDDADGEQEYTMFHPSEVELSETTRAILEQVARVRPRRVVFDSLSEMRLLAQNSLRYRRQILALKQYFVGREATLLLLDDCSDGTDSHLQSIAHGVIALETRSPELGEQRRRLRITKVRGSDFRGGWHDYRIRRGGLEVYPRLVAAEHRTGYHRATLSTGLPQLDELMGGGMEEGTSALLVGPAGSGKSSLALRMATTACDRGERAIVFVFDESPDTLVDRGDSLGMRTSEHVADGRLTIEQIDPAELSPGEFAHRVRRAIDGNGEPGASVVVIDSLNGYLNAMPDDRHLVIQLHELLSYLRQRKVMALLVMAQQGLLGAMHSPVDTSYLADTVVLLRYFEAVGSVRKAISVMKKRTGRHERTIRELRMDETGVVIGDVLTEFRGVLTGVPTYQGRDQDLLADGDPRRGSRSG